MMQQRCVGTIGILLLGLTFAACEGAMDPELTGEGSSDVPIVWDPGADAGELNDPDVRFGVGDLPEWDGGGAGPGDPPSPLCTPDPCDHEAYEVCDPETGDCVCADDACDVDGMCHPDGGTAPGDHCLSCDTEAATDAWSPVDGAICDDDNICTKNDHCIAGVCAGDPLDCDDGNHCSTDSCDLVDGCVHKPNTLPCDDGNPCTASDTCTSGVCLGSSTNCDDANACTSDSCDVGTGCVYEAVPCADGDACTSDSCDPITGCVFAPVDCDDADACTSDGCDPGHGCLHAEVDCEDSNACTSDGCDPGQGCVHLDVDCDDGDVCTEDACTPVSGCLHAAVVCDDGDPCTQEACHPGVGCQGVPLVCDDGDVCTEDSCVPAQGCVFVPLACDDGDICTDDSCQAGIGCVYTPIDCDDGDPCSLDTCDPAIGCQHSITMEICDGLDNDCNGLIDDLPSPAPTVWFWETFASNGQGWTMDATWAIGPTALSSGQSYAGPDPVHDHTDTSDDGVAGVVLGGNAPTDLHDFYYLTSPPVDVSAAPGEVHLGYRRWLNSDYTPYMANTVEVFDGAVWQVLWQTGSSPSVQDSEWMKVNHDLTVYKNANLRVRFGYDIGSAGVFTVAGWNVDDVVISDHEDLDVVLFEDFGDEGLGWILGPHWAIGTTTASSGQQYGNPDPAEDTSPGEDNGIAGVLLGGNAPKDLHDWYWLTSPSRDTTTFGSTYLRYMRWLNSDYLPYMSNRVEVWDGVSWQVLWETGTSPGIQDNVWTLQIHDLTPFKNAALQVRFGYMIGNAGVFSVSSWNIDDLAIVEGLPACD